MTPTAAQIDGRDPIPTSTRDELIATTCIQTHFDHPRSVYSADGVTASPQVVSNLIASGLGAVRQTWWPGSRSCRDGLAALASAGFSLYLTLRRDIKPGEVAGDIEVLDGMSWAGAVIAVEGINEPNAAGGDSWPPRVAAIQSALTEALTRSSHLIAADVGGIPLMRNVGHAGDRYTADVQAIAATNVGAWCDLGVFHHYPGNGGPVLNAGEVDLVRPIYELDGGEGRRYVHGETGWTGADTDPWDAERMTWETYLRNYLHRDADGQPDIILTNIYEAADESATLPGREGRFGVLDAQGHPKPAYYGIRRLVGIPDGGTVFRGRLSAADDATPVVFSNGGDCIPGSFQLYLLRGELPLATVIVPPDLNVFSYVRGVPTLLPFEVGSAGNRRFAVTFPPAPATAVECWVVPGDAA